MCGRAARAAQPRGSSRRPSRTPSSRYSRPSRATASVVAYSPLKPEADLASGAVAHPAGRADAQRVQQPGPQVRGERPAGDPLDDRAQGVGVGLVVGEVSARVAVRREEQESAHGLGGVPGIGGVHGLALVAAGHGGQVADPHRPAAGVGDVRRELGEVGDHRGVEVDQALGLGEGGGGHGEVLAERVQQVRAAGGVRRPPARGDHSPVPEDHQAVGFDVGGGFEGVEEGVDAGGVHTLGGGCGGGQRIGTHAAILPGRVRVIHRFRTGRTGTRTSWCRSDTR